MLLELCGGYCGSEDYSLPAMITLRVTGLGHTLTLEVESSLTVGELKQRIEDDTELPVDYQRLLARGSKLEDNESTLASEGIKDRTKIMLMHSALYAQEKEGFEALSKLSKEIDDLAAKKDSSSPIFVREEVTRICCRLDEVDTKGSSNLRATRKKLLAKAEALDETHHSRDEGESNVV
jgi:large subunit ribosomal protein L40e